MTIAVASQPAAAPPQNNVTVTLPGTGGIMQKVAVYRADNGAARALIRNQPATGLDTRLVIDREMPYGVPSVYSWDVTYYDPSFVTILYTTDWSTGIAGWATVDTSWSATANTLTWTAGDEPSAAITRSVASGLYRVEFTAPPKSIRTIDFGGFQIDAVAQQVIGTGLSNAAFQWGTGAVAIIASTNTVTITTTAGTWSFTIPNVYIDKVRFLGPLGLYTSSTAVYTGTSTDYRTLAGTSATTDAGLMFEWDTNAKQVVVYNGETGAVYTTFGASGTGTGQIDAFAGLATDGTNVYIASVTYNVGGTALTAAKVMKFTPSGGSWVYSSTTSFTIGTGAGQVSMIAGVAWGNATLWIYDEPSSYSGSILTFGTRRVLALTAALAISSTTTVASGQLNANTYWKFAADGASIPKLYFTDSNVLRRYDATSIVDDTPTGAYASTLLVNGVYSMTADTIGQVYVDVKSGTGANIQSYHRIVKFNRYGTSATDFVTPYYLASSSSYNTLGIHVGPTTGTIYLTARLIVGTMPTDGVTAPTYTPLAWSITKWPQTRTVISPVTIKQFGRVTTLSETAAPVTMTVTDAWLIHPASPGLSVRVPLSDYEFGVQEIRDATNEARSTEHVILGASAPVVTTFGPRGSDRFELELATKLRSDELALVALLADQTPILVNFPDSAGYDIPLGFYQVGDVNRARAVQFPDDERFVTLPLVAVESPVVVQANTGWSWAQLAASFPTWDAVKAAFATWADVAANNRRPGY